MSVWFHEESFANVCCFVFAIWWIEPFDIPCRVVIAVCSYNHFSLELLSMVGLLSLNCFHLTRCLIFLIFLHQSHVTNLECKEYCAFTI